MKESDIRKVAKNYSLLESAIFNSKGIKFEEQDEKFNVDIEIGTLCPKHTSPIHSYLKSNKSLLCS